MKLFIKSFLFITIFVVTGLLGVEHASAQQTYFLDTTFDPGTGLNSDSFNGEVQPDQKLVLPGAFTQYNGATANRIVRINTDGTIDSTFATNVGTGFNSTTYGVTVQPDGKLIVVGVFSQFNGVSRNSIVRLNADGTLDTSFNATAAFPGVLTFYHTSVQADGKIIIVGNYAATVIGGITYRNIIRLNSDGTIDPTFDTAFVGASTSFSRIQSDGKIIVTGGNWTVDGIPRSRIVRLNIDGTVDTTFDPGTGFNGNVHRNAILPDGKIITVGAFTSFNGTPINRVARLNPNGTLDTTFNVGTGFNAGQPAPLFIQPNGKMGITGAFTSYNGVTRNGIARLNSDGTLDTSFDTASGITGGVANADILSQHYLGNEKFYIAGTFTAYDGVSRNRVARIKYVDSTAPVLSPITLTSNNTNPSYAKVGDIITLSFSTDDALTGSTITIGGQTVTPVCNDTGLATIPCTATLTVTAGIPLTDGIVPFSITAVSNGGTTGPTTTTTNGSSVTVDRSIAPVTILTPTNNTSIYGGLTTISGTCDASVTTVTITGTGFTPSPTTATCTGGTYSAVVTITAGGTITTTQTDLANNTSTATSTYMLTATSGSSGSLGGGSWSSTTAGKDTSVAVSTTPVTTPTKLPTTTAGTTYISPVDGTTKDCRPFTTYLKIGKKNDTSEVKLWQAFLNKHMGEKLMVSGTYNKTTESAIKRFQSKYADEVLKPWGLTKPTGYTYQSTRAQGNKILGCGEGSVTLDNGVVIK